MTVFLLYMLVAGAGFFFTLTSPLSLAAMVILTATIVSLFMYLVLMTSWLSFILFMIFISAMMVIFVYVASLTSNDFLVSPPTFSFGVPLLMLFFFIASTPDTLSDLTPLLNSSTLYEQALTVSLVCKIYAPYTLVTSLFLIFYLLIVLIVVAKNTMTMSAPLRSYF